MKFLVNMTFINIGKNLVKPEIHFEISKNAKKKKPDLEYRLEIYS